MGACHRSTSLGQPGPDTSVSVPRKRWLAVSLLATSVWLASCGSVTSVTSVDAATETDAATLTGSVALEPDEVDRDGPGLITVDDPIRIENAHQGFADGPPVVERIAEHAEVVVHGQLLAIGPTSIGTPSGEWEQYEDGEQLGLQRALSPIHTELQIRVFDVLGQRSGLSEVVTPGELITPVLYGGTFSIEVTPAMAAATGWRPDISHEEEQANIDAGVVPDGPGPPPDESFTASWESSYTVDLTEGDEVVVFLRRPFQWDSMANDGSFLDRRILFAVSAQGAGFFTASDGDDYRQATHGEVVSFTRLNELADQVADRTGEVAIVGPGDLYTEPSG